MTFFLLLGAWGTCDLFAQARMVFNGGGSVVIENGGRVVIDNPNPNAITNPGQGNLISEAEQDMVKWNIGTNTGTYSLPYQDNTGEGMRFDMEVVTAGSGSGHFLFSTYDGPDWDNYTYRPSDVTHMNDYATGSVNNSDYVIDRFWIVDAEGYSTKPEPDMSIGYHSHELQTNGGNDGSLTNEGELAAQRFNNSANEWGDLLPVGSNPGPNPVQNVQVSPSDFFRSWTLVNQNNPLPVELLSFEADCRDAHRKLTWRTASESNNAYFLLERSEEGHHYEVLDTIEGAGTTPTGSEYAYRDETLERHYYRLVQVDHDGKKDTLSQVVGAPCEKEGGASLRMEVRSNGGARPELYVRNPKDARNATFRLYDARGRIVQESEERLHPGVKRIDLSEDLERGVYHARLRTDQDLRTRKIVLHR